MIIANFVTNRATQSDTRTYEDFYRFLGTRPAKLGVVSRLYPELTASYLTESLRNIFYQDVKSGNRYQSIDSMYFYKEVHVKPFELLGTPTSDSFRDNQQRNLISKRRSTTIENLLVSRVHIL